MLNKLAFMLSCLLFVSHGVMAVTCFSPNASTYNVSLGGTFYAGEDLPIGTTLYRTTVINQNSFDGGIECDGSFSLDQYLGVANEPSGPAFSLSGTGLVGKVYPTNVAGVGVALWWNNKTVTLNDPVYVRTVTDPVLGHGFVADMSLIKTGPITTGLNVNGSSIPTFIFYVPSTPGYAGLPVSMIEVHFSGSVNFVTSTCKTPDVNVSMGSYEISKYFKGIGSVTPWVDASIKLQGCPRFNGYGYQQQVTGSGTPSGTSHQENLFTVELNPNTPILDSVNGIFSVDASITGGSAATGVGVQLGFSADVNANPTTPANIWKPGNTWGVVAPSDGRSNIDIPISARYYQVANNVTPGAADGKVMFTISYK